jgi:hypothetical protein
MILRQFCFGKSDSVACLYPLKRAFCFEICREIYQNMVLHAVSFCLVV